MGSASPEAVTQPTKDLRNLLLTLSEQRPGAKTKEENPTLLLEGDLKPRLRSHRGPHPTLQWITFCLTDHVSLNHCIKYAASNLPFSKKVMKLSHKTFSSPCFVYFSHFNGVNAQNYTAAQTLSIFPCGPISSNSGKLSIPA